MTELENVRSELEEKTEEVTGLEEVIAAGKLRLEEKNGGSHRTGADHRSREAEIGGAAREGGIKDSEIF